MGEASGRVAIIDETSLGRYGDGTDREKAHDLLLAKADQEKGSVFEAILALNAIDYLDEVGASRMASIRQLPRKPGKPSPRMDGYAGSLLKHLTGEAK